MSTSSIKYNESKVTSSHFLTSLAILLFAWAAVYQDALIAMEAIWSRSDTFAHGYFILPISLWLLWRDKEILLASAAQPTWLPIPLLAISLFVGLFSYAADINVLVQLSAVTSLIFLLWSLVGHKLAWRYKFPLSYLIFAVPMGENLIPWLQDVTAWFTVFFLKLNGIPVFVDGLYIQIPTGMFEVAVACSGIRYLIASLAVGTLYAYLTYNKTHKQLIFFIFALCLPILANGIRAYGIVAIAYYSDMKYATGADHLIYGWVFFGLIIMLMFWIGGFFADKQIREEVEPIEATTKFQSKSSLLALFLMGGAFTLLQSMPITTNPAMPSLALHGKEAQNSNWGISFVGGLSRSHIINEAGIETFVAKFANRQVKGELIASSNVIFNPDKWTIVKSQNSTTSESSFKFIVLRDMQGNERSILFRYVVGDIQSTSKMKVKAIQAWDSLFHNSSHGYIEAVSVGNSQNLPDVENTLNKALNDIRRIE